MSEYFIKRGEKIHGPFSTKQVKSGLESGKLKDADLISERKDGPWQTVDLLQEPAPVAEVIAEDLPAGEGSLFDSVEIPAATTFKPSYAAVQPSGTGETSAKQETRSVGGKPAKQPTAMSALEEAEKELKQQEQEQSRSEAWNVSSVSAGISVLGKSTWIKVKEEGISSGIQNLKHALSNPEQKPAATGLIALALSPVILLCLMGPLYLLGSALMPETSSYQASGGIKNAQNRVDAGVADDQARTEARLALQQRQKQNLANQLQHQSQMHELDEEARELDRRKRGIYPREAYDRAIVHVNRLSSTAAINGNIEQQAKYTQLLIVLHELRSTPNGRPGGFSQYEIDQAKAMVQNFL